MSTNVVNQSTLTFSPQGSIPPSSSPPPPPPPPPLPLSNSTMSSDSSPANQSTDKPYPSVPDSGTTRPTNSFSPSLIAIVVIIPIGLILLTFIYWRGRFWRKESLPGLRNQSGTRTVILLPPGGTGADLPEGQRRSDRMRRNRFVGRGRRPSRSESVRTVPEYSADPQDTEMTLARATAQRNAGDSQPSFLMRLIGQHHYPAQTPRTIEEEEQPPPDYECETGRQTEEESGGSNQPDPSSSSSSNPTLTTPPQSHTIQLTLDRTYTSTSSIGSTSSSTRIPKPLRALFQPILNDQVNSSNMTNTTTTTNTNLTEGEIYRLPNSGPTPDQIRFLGSPSNLSRLGVNRSPQISPGLIQRSSFIILPPSPALTPSTLNESNLPTPSTPPPPFPSESLTLIIHPPSEPEPEPEP